LVSRSNPQPRTHRTTKVEHAASPAQASTRTNDPTRTPAVAATIDASPSRAQDVCGHHPPTHHRDKATEHKARKNRHSPRSTRLPDTYLHCRSRGKARRHPLAGIDIDALLTPRSDSTRHARPTREAPPTERDTTIRQRPRRHSPVQTRPNSITRTVRNKNKTQCPSPAAQPARNRTPPRETLAQKLQPTRR
jgi:hypothetical protein